MIHREVVEEIEQIIGPIEEAGRVGGGCISNASRVIASGRSYFLKWSDGDAGRTFEAEGEGLRILRRGVEHLLVPEVVSAHNAGGSRRKGHILMDWIEEGSRRGSFWTDLGTGLAELHRSTGDSFGFSSDNFIGRIEQRNTPHPSWPMFFLENRLVFQRDLARKMGRWRSAWDTHFDALVDRLSDILPGQPPFSLVHGDLWGGNVLADHSGMPVLIDPAAHYAHREVDLAMSELFGGFAPAFYSAYREAWPLEPGYSDRRDIYNLYHLINHLNHFGQSYAGQVHSILRSY